ncbi:MAG: V-type ATP synthase subunit I [Treponema sp.]|jgi:V/A-type H+-transporting ATPase subunit I|nr:V-type ATP synthase subunit I [Treponema sp.]
MKKVSLVVMQRERDNSLDKLREIGVVHLEKKSVFSDALGKHLDRHAKIVRALGILRRYPVKKGTTPPYLPHAPSDADLVVHILGLADEKKILQDQISYNARERRRIEPWGDFDPDSFAWMEKHGVKLIPYELSLKEYNSLGDDIKLIVITKDKRTVRALSTGSIPGIPPFILHHQSLSQIDNRIDNIYLRIDEIETELAALAYRKKTIADENSRLQSEIDFETASAGMEKREDASSVCWLCGFIPVDKLGVLKRSAAEYGWALIWEDITPADRPPTLVRNNAAVRIIQPLFSFLGTVPGYREYDISLSYLIFFCLFFAMIFGDAAYGLLLFTMSAAAALAFKKKRGQVPDAAKLFMLLSFCTVIWGSITGSWFAIPTEKLPQFLRSLVIPPFNDAGHLAQFPFFLQKLLNLPAEVPVDELKTRWNIQFLCFTVGAVQLVWARGKNVIKQLPSLTALAQAGWLTMMVGLYFLVLFMLLKVALPPFAVWLIGGGAAAYFIFAEQNGGNFFKNIGKSFTNFLSIFLTAVGSFADIISYIRLFAVGLAGGIIAESFNNMAIPVEGFGDIGLNFALRLLAAILILVFGHALNMVMNALSVVVHGVRLNLLEYAGNHLGMEWSGYAYKPFARETSLQEALRQKK